MSDIVETLKSITATKGRDHRSGKEFIRLDDSQAVVDAIATAYDEITRLRRELADARNAALEEAATLVDEGFDHGIKRKQDTCDHGTFGWEDCEQCASAAIRSMKEKAE